MRLVLGDRSYDLSTRALVMGILNRTPDSFFDRGATYELEMLLARAETLVTDGADLLDIAPTVLDAMGLPVPAEMTGTSLLRP